MTALKEETLGGQSDAWLRATGEGQMESQLKVEQASAGTFFIKADRSLLAFENGRDPGLHPENRGLLLGCMTL